MIDKSQLPICDDLRLQRIAILTIEPDIEDNESQTEKRPEAGERSEECEFLSCTFPELPLPLALRLHPGWRRPRRLGLRLAGRRFSASG